MGLLSKFKFGNKAAKVSAPSAGATSEASEITRDARIRARRRLIGASLLLGIGIVSFPLLFESRPRPIPVDIPIDIPAREGVAPLAPPVARATPIRAQTGAVRVQAEQAVAGLGDGEMVEASPPPASGAKPAVPAASKPAAPKPAASKPAELKPPPKPEPKPDTKPAAVKTTEHTADDGRFVVQIGAFAEVASAHEARMKVEGMGLKTYTQVIESASGRRIRVRVGPYPNKAEAEKAAAKIKSGGLQAAVLLL
jgi:DedD protein